MMLGKWLRYGWECWRRVRDVEIRSESGRLVPGNLTCLVTITATARRIFGLLGRKKVLGGVEGVFISISIVFSSLV